MFKRNQDMSQCVTHPISSSHRTAFVNQWLCYSSQL